MTPLDAHSGTLSQLLTATAMRHQAVSQNLANVNTPGYQRLEVSFEDQFKQALGGQTDVTQAAGVKAKVTEVADGSSRLDGNTVDLDQELGELQRTALMFQTSTKLLETRLAMMRRAMEGR